MIKTVNPMSLTNEAILEFQELYRREFGKTISREQAIELGTKLIDLIAIVFGKGKTGTLDGRNREAYHKHGHN